jgi:hypothetical protein
MICIRVRGDIQLIIRATEYNFSHIYTIHSYIDQVPIHADILEYCGGSEVNRKKKKEKTTLVYIGNSVEPRMLLIAIKYSKPSNIPTTIAHQIQ